MENLRIFAISAFTVLLFLPACSFAQGRSIYDQIRGEEEQPKSFRESLERLRIDKEKKEFDEMIDRGEQVVALSVELEKAVEANGTMSSGDLEKLSSIEKLAKKVRSGLGGDDDDEQEAKGETAYTGMSTADAVRSLRLAADELETELKKTSRFSISASAIKKSNSVIRLAKAMRGVK